MIEAYRLIDMDLIMPTVRSEVEKRLNQIADGKEEFEKVRDEILELYKKKYIAFTKNFSKIEDLFQSIFLKKLTRF